MATIIDGKAVSASVRAQIKERVEDYLKSTGKRPGLAVIIVGDNPASKVYVKNKKLACEQVGFYSEEYALSENTSRDELILLINKLNKREDIDGILVQLPLPSQIDEESVIQAIAPEKDVDAFGYANVGKIMVGNFDFLPCTPAGVMELLHAYNIDVSGKNALVIGRSNIVGKPQAMLLLHENATVTVAHSKTPDIADIARRSDIIVCAVGRPAFLKGDMVKNGAVVIDVGINRAADGKLCGDVDFDEVEKKASFITPVPGGVGPMTITMLMKNTLTSFEAKIK